MREIGRGENGVIFVTEKETATMLIESLKNAQIKKGEKL